MKKIKFSFLIKTTLLITIFFVIFSFTSFSKNQKKNIMFISSYSPDFMTFTNQIEGIKDSLKGFDYNLSIQYMDTKYFYNKRIINLFKEKIRIKLEMTKFDCIIVADDNAYNLALEERNNLFKNKPIIFLGVNNIENATKANEYENITGIVENISLKKTIDIANKLQSSAKNVIAIADPTLTSQSDLKKFKTLKNSYPYLNFKIFDSSNLTINKILSELQNISKDDIIILLSLYKDYKNNNLTFSDSLELLIKNSNSPIFHPYMHGIGDGLIGGHTVNHFEQGRRAGNIVKTYFLKGSLSSISVLEKSPNTYFFDANIFKKFNLDLDNLPKSSIIINNDSNILEKYWKFIVPSIFILIIQSILIFYLFHTIKHKNIMESNLRKNKNLLKIQNQQLISQYKKLSIAKNNLKTLETRSEIASVATDIGLFDKNILNNDLYITIDWYNKYLNNNNLYENKVFNDFYRLIIPENRKKYMAHMNNLFKTKDKIYSIEFPIKPYDSDEIIWIEENGVIVRNDNLEIERVIGSHKNITIQKEKNKKIYNLIQFDSLTGLHNKKSIEMYITQLIKDENDKKHAILFLDIDNFKYINDTYGHNVGDQILIKFSKIIKDQLTENQFIGRFGGDDFILVVKNYNNKNELDKFIKRINFNLNIIVDSINFNVRPSIGVAVFPEHGKNTSDLISRADLSMFEAKSQKNKIYITFDKKLKQKYNFIKEIKNGIKNNEFYMVFQPIINTFDNSLFSTEALIRWDSKSFGFVPPNEFIKIAEENGLIYDLGLFTIEESIKFSIKTSKLINKDIKISINLSPIQINDKNIVEDISSLINKYSINPNLIVFEITESAVMKNIKNSLSTINQLKKLGVKIALDDFGTGYSSLNYLRNIPVDILKIDKSFIDLITENEKDIKLIEAILMIAKNENLEVIAEGVETKSQLKVLNSVGCKNIQGYYFSKPLKIEIFKDFIYNYI